MPRNGEIAHVEIGQEGPAKENDHSPVNNPGTQDTNMKDAPSCEKCGQIFPWNQLHLRWKHKCSGSAESDEGVKPAFMLGKNKTLPRRAGSGVIGSSTTSRSGESGIEPAAADEDAPKCEKCGRTFPWNQLHLRWKHKCEPPEVSPAPDPPLRRTQSSASNLRRPVSVARMEELFTASTVEHGVTIESDDAPLVCRCGQTFTENERREFVIHKLQCRERSPPVPPGAGRQARGAT